MLPTFIIGDTIVLDHVKYSSVALDKPRTLV